MAEWCWTGRRVYDRDLSHVSDHFLSLSARVLSALLSIADFNRDCVSLAISLYLPSGRSAVSHCWPGLVGPAYTVSLFYKFLPQLPSSGAVA